MEYDEILEMAIQMKVKYPMLRLGQVIHNTFSEFVETKGLPNCFYNDEKIPEFLAEVKKSLKEDSNEQC